MNTYIFISNIDKGPGGYRTEVIRNKTLGSALHELKQANSPVMWGDINEAVEIFPDGLVIQYRNMQEQPEILEKTLS